MKDDLVERLALELRTRPTSTMLECEDARAVLSIARPTIRKEALEEAAQVAEGTGKRTDLEKRDAR